MVSWRQTRLASSSKIHNCVNKTVLCLCLLTEILNTEESMTVLLKLLNSFLIVEPFPFRNGGTTIFCTVHTLRTIISHYITLAMCWTRFCVNRVSNPCRWGPLTINMCRANTAPLITYQLSLWSQFLLFMRYISLRVKIFIKMATALL